MKPEAWKITGSRTWCDKVVELEDRADRSIQERDDGSFKVPLYAIPAGHVVVSEGLLRSALTHAHNRGYLAGHHDTVEAQFSHILSSELDSYRSEQVEDILQALLGEGKEHE